LLGVADGARLEGFLAGTQAFCSGAGYTGEELRLILLRYVQRQPQQMSQPGGYIALNSMIEAFPCR
jgi:hypothetical protein